MFMLFQKEVYVTYRQSDCDLVRELLENNHIATTVKVNGIGDPGRYHANLHAALQSEMMNSYRICVSRKDYETARHLLGK